MIIVDDSETPRTGGKRAADASRPKQQAKGAPADDDDFIIIEDEQ
jgi:hypothetical protein